MRSTRLPTRLPLGANLRPDHRIGAGDTRYPFQAATQIGGSCRE